MKMYRRFAGGLAVAALVVASSSNAFATKITISGNDRYRAGEGGEFNVRAADADAKALIGDVLTRGYIVTNGTTIGTADGTAMGGNALPGDFGTGFETFCIEKNEFINLPGTYEASISRGSIYGGKAGGIDDDSDPLTPTTDYISVGTAYLYNAFATGALTGYTYTDGAGRAASAVKLQEAFWYLEDEISLNAGQIAANPFLSAAIALYGVGTGVGVGGAKANNTIWDVAALNLGGIDPNQKQDQLILHVFEEPSPPAVPDGGTTLVLLGLSLGGLGYLRRKLG